MTEIALSLEELAASRESVYCSYCQEPIVHDGDIYRHVRTGLSAMGRSQECQPLCKFCGARATRAIGGYRYLNFDGCGPRFTIDHFACADCVKKSGAGFIEHIR
jgi:hypothetical protein